MSVTKASHIANITLMQDKIFCPINHLICFGDTTVTVLGLLLSLLSNLISEIGRDCRSDACQEISYTYMMKGQSKLCKPVCRQWLEMSCPVLAYSLDKYALSSHIVL